MLDLGGGSLETRMSENRGARGIEHGAGSGVVMPAEGSVRESIVCSRISDTIPR